MTDSTTTPQYRFKDVAQRPGVSAFRKYRDLYYGDCSVLRMLLCELLITSFNWIPGALGLLLRKVTYPWMFQQSGRGVVFGRNLTIRHPHRIRIGNEVIIDDSVVLDAKGSTNQGIAIGPQSYIGRNTIIYCKNGDIRIGARVNIASNCQLFSANELSIGADTIIGAYSYFLSGGEYDYNDRQRRFSEQNGLPSKGPVTIGENCWISARVTVLDAARVGDHCVVGPGAVVNRDIPTNTISMGMPAKVIKNISL